MSDTRGPDRCRSRAAEQGQGEVYVQSYPEPTRPWRVSTTGGGAPRWSRNGQELVYLAPDNTLMAARIEMNGPEIEIDRPVALFRANPSREYHQPGTFSYDVTADGQRFIVNERIVAPVRDAQSEPNQIATMVDYGRTASGEDDAYTGVAFGTAAGPAAATRPTPTIGAGRTCCSAMP